MSSKKMHGDVMITLSMMTGQTIHVSEDEIVRVTDALPTDSGQRTYIHGPTDAAIVTSGDAQALLARIDPGGAFVKLTRPEGSRVWIRSATVSAVRGPLPHETPSPGTVNAVAIAAGANVMVRESVDAVLTAIGWA